MAGIIINVRMGKKIAGSFMEEEATLKVFIPKVLLIKTTANCSISTNRKSGTIPKNPKLACTQRFDFFQKKIPKKIEKAITMIAEIIKYK